MNNIDDKILEALNSEDKEMMDSYGKELGFWGLMGESFRGKMKGMVFTVLLLILLFFPHLHLVLYSLMVLL